MDSRYVLFYNDGLPIYRDRELSPKVGGDNDFMKNLLRSRRIIWMVPLIVCGAFLIWRILPPPGVKVVSHPKRATDVDSIVIFKEVTSAAGLSFRHWCGDSGEFFFPEVMGSGIALIDFDRDG